MMLFICHGSEDRDEFVLPLAEALSKEYEKIWYSEYELRLGDRLLEKNRSRSGHMRLWNCRLKQTFL